MPLAQEKTDTRQVDNKGRLTLPPQFANRAVIVRGVDETEVIVTMARVIPEREAWLYDNLEAKKAVFTGIENAREGKFSDAPPDLEADSQLVNGVGDGDE